MTLDPKKVCTKRFNGWAGCGCNQCAAALANETRKADKAIADLKEDAEALALLQQLTGEVF